jgi:hypothetical protein
MTINQEEVTTAIAVGRSVAQGDDAEAAEATVRLARRAGPDAVRFLRHIVRAERGVSIPQQVRAACALLEVGRFLGPSAEARATEAFRGVAGADGAPERNDA